MIRTWLWISVCALVAATASTIWAEERTVQRVYAMEGLLGRADAEGHGDAAGLLIRMITKAVAPTTWSVAGGVGTVEYYPLGQALVVSQSAEVHGQIAALMQSLREWQDYVRPKWKPAASTRPIE